MARVCFLGLGSISVAALRGEIGSTCRSSWASVVAVSVAVIVLNLVVDVVYAVIDPRIRLA